MFDPVNDAQKKLEDRLDAVELRSKLLAGKLSEIAQILEVKSIDVAKSIVDRAVDVKIEEKTKAVAQQVEEKTQAVAQQVEQKRVELEQTVEEKRVELANKIEVARAKSHEEIVEVNMKSIHRARRVYSIVITIVLMTLLTGLMGFHMISINVGLTFSGIAFGILVYLISGL